MDFIKNFRKKGKFYKNIRNFRKMWYVGNISLNISKCENFNMPITKNKVLKNDTLFFLRKFNKRREKLNAKFKRNMDSN